MHEKAPLGTDWTCLPIFKLKSVIVTLYGPVLVLVKISVLLQYIRIFVPHRQGWFYIGATCLIGINVLYYTTTMLLVIFQVSTE